jgi:uncharacterized membrane protein YcaP (DUF421 family)
MMETLHSLIGTKGHDISVIQMSLRAVLIFVLGLVIVQLAATRAFGKWSALDIILAVVVGYNLSRAMTGSMPRGDAPCYIRPGVLHGLLARSSAQCSWLSALTKGGSVNLVKVGVIDFDAMRRSGIRDGDLRMALRSAGHTDLSGVGTVLAGVKRGNQRRPLQVVQDSSACRWRPNRPTVSFRLP